MIVKFNQAYKGIPANTIMEVEADFAMFVQQAGVAAILSYLSQSQLINADGSPVDIAALLASVIQKSKIVDGAGNALYPSGLPVKLTTEIIRPANVLDYAANDAVNSSIALPVVSAFDKSAAIALGGGGMITFAKIEAPAAFGGKSFTVIIYNDVPTTIQGDNVPFMYDAANTLKRVCQFVITMGAVINGSAVVTGQEVPFIEYQCAATSKDLKALIFVNDAVVAPTSAGKITLSLTTVQQA